MKAKSAAVFYNAFYAGVLTKQGNKYTFRYDDEYLHSDGPPISLTFPKTRQQYVSNHLFPFFAGLLSEGTNKSLQTRQLRVDDGDEFSRLLLTAHTQTIGAVTVRELPAHE